MHFLAVVTMGTWDMWWTVVGNSIAEKSNQVLGFDRFRGLCRGFGLCVGS